VRPKFLLVIPRRQVFTRLLQGNIAVVEFNRPFPGQIVPSARAPSPAAPAPAAAPSAFKFLAVASVADPGDVALGQRYVFLLLFQDDLARRHVRHQFFFLRSTDGKRLRRLGYNRLGTVRESTGNWHWFGGGRHRRRDRLYFRRRRLLRRQTEQLVQLPPAVTIFGWALTHDGHKILKSTGL
jgi:hypothetical protein